MKGQLLSLTAVLAMLAGCPDTPPETAVDVAQAREEIAMKKLTDGESAAMIETLDADFEVASPEPKSGYDVAQSKCDALNGVERTACFSAADAATAANLAEAATVRDAAMEIAERFDH